MSEITIRTAQAADREAVLAFCTDTWDWGDYVAYVWDDWLINPTGKFLVALSADEPVGIVHLHMLNADEAWQEGMRVAPAYRRQGIARQLSMAALAEAMHRGANTVRLMTASVNTASIGLIESMHFHRVGVLAPYKALPLTDIPRSNLSQDTLTLATAADLDEIINYLDISSVFPATGGLYYSGFTGYRISDNLLNSHIQNGHIYLLRRWERLDGLAIVEPRPIDHSRQLFVGYIDGTTESISLIAYALRYKLSQIGLENIEAHIPDLMMIRDAFAGAEYESTGDLFYTYERGLI